MSAFAVSAGLVVLAVVAVHPSRSAQRWLLFALSLCLRVLLFAVVVALAAAAVLPDRLLEAVFFDQAGLAWRSLPDRAGVDFRQACTLSALALTCLSLPCLAILDFARALASHAAWLQGLDRRLTAADRPTPPPAAARPAARPSSAQARRTLDELLG